MHKKLNMQSSMALSTKIAVDGSSGRDGEETGRKCVFA